MSHCFTEFEHLLFLRSFAPGPPRERTEGAGKKEDEEGEDEEADVNG